MPPATKTRKNLYGFEFRERDKRRANEDGKPGYNIQQLWQSNHEILNLAAMGLKQKAIAERLGVSEVTVSNTINSDLGMAKIAKLREQADEAVTDVMTEVAKMLPRALEVYDEILHGNNSSEIQRKVADTVVMDISGYRAPARSQSIVTHMTADEVREIREAGDAAMKSAGIIMDIDYEEAEEA